MFPFDKSRARIKTRFLSVLYVVDDDGRKNRRYLKCKIYIMKVEETLNIKTSEQSIIN